MLILSAQAKFVLLSVWSLPFTS